MQEATQIIKDSKNIYLIPSESQEAVTATMALFYTLKELGKNVNLLIETLPEELKFLTPSLDFISFPKNFVISIPSKIAKISQIYYEKNDEALKVHLTLENGNIKKDNISFYYSETKPDLIITVGVNDYQHQLKNMDSLGFLLDSPILNIDNATSNKKFGRINQIGTTSLTQIIIDTIKELHVDIKKELATCLLAGVVVYTRNFKNNVTAETFDTASNLMKSGADLKNIITNIKVS